MSSALLESQASTVSVLACRISIGASAGALLCLVSLHFLSPEFDPSWRMVSEYALGSYPLVLSLMFLCWALSSWSLAYALHNAVSTRWGRIGIGFLVAAGFGELMASIFDVSHPLHGVAAGIGGPSLPVAAMLISVHLCRMQRWSHAKKSLMLAARSTWISFVIFAIAMVVFLVSFGLTGEQLNRQPVPALPEGVIALHGWTNRLWIVMYNLWVMVAAMHAIRIRKERG
jgi:hypothetical protein